MNFQSHCGRVWASRFFRRLGSFYWQRWPRGPWQTAKDAVVLDENWRIATPRKPGAFLRNTIKQFDAFRRVGFGIRTTTAPTSRQVWLIPGDKPDHEEGFEVSVVCNGVAITSRTEKGLAQGLFHLERVMELRGAPILPIGRQTCIPRFDLRLHCDVWGGYTVTPRWLDVPHRKETFLLMARHGINATQIRAKLGDFFHDPRYPEISNPHWKQNLERLRRVAGEASDAGLSLILHADNFRLPPDHKLFRRKPSLKGAPIFTGVICPICTGAREGLELIARGWEEIFRAIPELGGMIAIVGGECFTHCAMRPVRDPDGRNPCPRCGPRRSSDVAADLIEEVGRRVRRAAPHAKILAWPYSAEAPTVWGADEAEMARFIRRMKSHAVYVLEIEKEGLQPVRNAPGVIRHIWDYSSSFVGPASRFRRQMAVANNAGVRVCVKTESLQAWEAVSVPWLPIMDHWQRRWTLLRRTPARDIHMGWPLFGFNDAPPMELAAWQLWNPAPDASQILDQMIARDFGVRAVAVVRRAYRLFGEALEMLPIHCMGYYVRIQLMGSANPLLLRKDEKIEDAFRNFFFYEGEGFATLKSEVKRLPLPYDDNWFRPHIYPKGQDPLHITAACVRRADQAWTRALRLYESVASSVPPHRRSFFQDERRILRHLACMWRTWDNAEEFYLHRSRLEAIRYICYWRRDLRSEYLSVLKRMLEIARDEMENSRRAWNNLRGDDRMDISLRLDTPTVPVNELYQAKFRHTKQLIAELSARIATDD